MLKNCVFQDIVKKACSLEPSELEKTQMKEAVAKVNDVLGKIKNDNTILPNVVCLLSSVYLNGRYGLYVDDRGVHRSGIAQKGHYSCRPQDN